MFVDIRFSGKTPLSIICHPCFGLSEDYGLLVDLRTEVLSSSKSLI